MTQKHSPSASAQASDDGPLGRRELLAYTAAFGSAFLAAQGLVRGEERDAKSETELPREESGKRYDMKKSINLWAFPYPQKMSLEDCFRLAKDAGFDGVEINFALEGEFSAESQPAEIDRIRKLAERVDIAISGICSFLYWPYSLTSPDRERRAKGLQLARQMIAAARRLGTDNLLVVPGAVYIPWVEGSEPVPNDVCERRAREAIEQLLPDAEKAGVTLNLENIFANAFLFSP